MGVHYEMELIDIQIMMRGQGSLELALEEISAYIVQPYVTLSMNALGLLDR